MASKKKCTDYTRKLIKGSTSYLVTVPAEYIRELGWKKNQKLHLSYDAARKQIVMKDWEE